MRNRLLILLFLAALISPAASQAQALILKADSVTVPCHDVDTFLISIRADNFTNVAGVQFTFAWNPAHLDYAYITEMHPALAGGGNSGFDTTSFVNQGKLTFVWATFGAGVSLPNNTVLFKVAFARLSGPASPVFFTDTPTDIVALDPTFNSIDVQTVPGLVTPLDNQPPTVTCPANVTMQVFGPTPVNNIPPTPLDNCSIESIGWSSTGATTGNFPSSPNASGSVFNIGQSTVTYQVEDAGGSTATCSFLINLSLAPNDSLTLIASNASGACGQTVTINITVLNFDSIGGIQFSLGWDPAVLEFDTITNANPSMFLAPSNFGLMNASNGQIGFAWTSGFPNGLTLSDGSVLFSLTFNVVATGTNGTSIAFGNSPTQMLAVLPNFQTIGFITVNGQANIQDTQPPVIQCPPNQFFATPVGVVTATFNNLAPVVLSDNCTPNVGLTYQQAGVTSGSGSGPANGTYNAGTTVVTYTASDASGNISTCSFSVVVDAGTPLTLILDTILVDCQATNAQIAVDLTVRDFINIIGLQFDITWDSSVIKFDSVGNLRPGLGLNPGMFFGFTSALTGNTLKFFGGNVSGWPTIPNDSILFTIYFTVDNVNGLSNINFTNTISAATIQGGIPTSIPVALVHGFFQSADLTPPILSCADFIAPADSGACTATFLLDPPPASDVCSGVQSVVANAPYDAAFIYPSGLTPVTFTATDDAGNTATCVVTVTVQGGDGLPQLNNCPPDVTVGITTASCSTVVTWDPPTALNPCDGSSLTVLASDTSGTQFPLGDHTVTFTTFNLLGDTTTCSFLVTVLDSLAPVFINCQDPAPVQADSTCSALIVIDPLVAGDNCTQNIVPVPDTDISLPFQVGITEVIYTATDDSGNSASCTLTITVFDGQPPVFDNCPNDVTVYAAADSCGASVFWDVLTATDDCSTNLNIDPPNYSGEFFPVGNTQVQYSVSDGFTQAGTCAFSVTVLDTLAPAFTVCPQSLTIFLPADKCDTLLTWLTPLADDGCGIDNISETHANPTLFPTGVHVVEYVAFDPTGNSATCSFTVTVLDVVPPFFTSPCPANIVIPDASPCGEIVQWVLPTAEDNCLLASVYSIPASDLLITATETTVVVYAEDASGNQDTCSFTVTLEVVFEPAAFLNFPNDTVVNGCPQPVSWTLPISNGKNCNPDTVTYFPDLNPGDTFPLGDTTITYYLIDLVTGDTLVQQPFTITVQDVEPPQFGACPQEPVVVHVAGVLISGTGFLTGIDTVAGCTGVELSYDPLTALDNCGSAVVDQTAGPLSGDFFEAGAVTTIVFTATDDVGNTSECVVNVAVLGLQPLNVVVDPPVACPTELVSLIADLIPGAVYNWTGPPVSMVDQNTDNMAEILVGVQNAGTYTVSASFNGCTTPPASAEITVYSVQAVPDTIIVTMGGGVDTFSVAANDLVFPPGDFVVDTCQGTSWPAGIIHLGNGVFTFDPSVPFRDFKFLYCICSASCPTVCDQGVQVIVRLDETDCSFIPNVITPNRDGVNDYFRIPCLDSEQFRDNSIVIFNQWGDKVFDAAPYTNMWDGTLNGESGKDLPDGVYYYIFQPGPNQAVRKGFVQIHR